MQVHLRGNTIIVTGWETTGNVKSIRVARMITGLTTSNRDNIVTPPEVAVYPNPAKEKIILNYKLDQPEAITISLCDPGGRTLRVLLPKTPRIPGSHVENLEIPQSLSTGNYLVNIQSGSWVKAIKVVVGKD